MIFDPTQRQQAWENAASDVFTRRAIDNSGILASPRHGKRVARLLCQLAAAHLIQPVDEAELISVTMQLAEQGLAFSTAVAMLQTLSLAEGLEPAELIKLNDFQLKFLENLAANQENNRHKRRENTQLALQQALHNQLEQQRRMHQTQKQRNENLNEVLQLNAQLVPITDESDLLSKAASGICQALNLTDVTIYDYQRLETKWVVRMTTATDIESHKSAEEAAVGLLNTAVNQMGEAIQSTPITDKPDWVAMAIILRLDSNKTSGMVINSENLSNYNIEEFAILIRTFSQNLTALWRNLLLLQETGQRTRELEILHGRYLDDIWNSETTTLQARYAHNNLQIERRQAHSANLTSEQSAITIPVGDRPFGLLKFPGNVNLSPDKTEFVQAIIREMSNALNTAQLLQTAHSFSNQLTLAAKVSSAANTILDRAQLTQEVVDLIRERFDFYYVGLFLVDESGDTAVLLAGTGNAGQQLVANGFKLPLDGSSMISTAISSGRAHIAQNVDLAQEFHRNPLLPDTQSELAVPLRTRGIITGVLTIQSDKTGVFVQETIEVLQTLADQLAVAIVNASLFARLQNNLDETNLLYDTSRKINSATTTTAVYEALIEFVRKSELADAAYIISHASGTHEFLIIPAFWSHIHTDYNWREKFLHDPFEPLSEKLTLINNCHKKTGLNPFTQHLVNVQQLHALALISITIEGEWLATLALQRGGNRVFTSGELNPLLTIVDQSAVILSNQQLLKQAKTLYKVGQTLSQVLTRDDALKIAVSQVAKYTGASQCRFILYDAPNNTGKIIAEHKPTNLADRPPFSIKDDRVFQLLSQEIKPLLIDEQADVPAASLEHYVHQLGTRATLLIPATSQQELLGVLTIESHRGKRPFTQANTIFAQTVVDHLTTQIENLNLLEEALSRAQELITLNQIQSGISGILDLPNLAQTIYNQIGRLLDNTIFILARYQTSMSQYEPILCVHEGQAIAADSRQITTDDPLYKLLFSQRHLVADAGHPIMQRPLIPDLPQPPQSSLWIPLLDDNQPTGLISLQSYEKKRYSETDVQLLRSIATQTNLAMANARLFEEIQARNEQLRQLDNLKNQFLANVSHELRTPLNSIIGFSKVILKGIDGPLTIPQREDVTAIYENGQMLLALINEILDMAKIEAGRMTVTTELIDAELTANRVLKNVRSLVDEANVSLTAVIEPNLPLLEADPVRLRQILNNLLSNAAKFTNRGHIRLQMQQQDEYLHISVEDTGIGIHQKDYQKLFRPFEQVENRDARVTGGTGLGLPITQWLVQMHNGRIWLESQPGKGSIFHILLPFEQPETESDNNDSSPSITPASTP